MVRARCKLLLMVLSCVLVICVLAEQSSAKVKRHQDGCITVQGKKVCGSFIPEDPKLVCSDDVSCGTADSGSDDGPPEDPPTPPPDQAEDITTPSTPDSDKSNPQVVTTLTQPGSGAATTAIPAPPPYDACRNVNGIQPSVPLGKVRTDEGDCVDPPENNVGLCQGDQFILTPVSKEADGLKAGQVLGPWVDGPNLGLVCWLSDLVTYHANPAEYFFTGFYVGDGGPQDGRFVCATPYDNWLLYPYYTKKEQVRGQLFPSANCNKPVAKSIK